MRKITRILILISIIHLIPAFAFAQMPGRWELSLRASRGWAPREMTFVDPSFGLVLADSELPPMYHTIPSSGCFRTTDGGKNWVFHSFLDSTILLDLYTTFSVPSGGGGSHHFSVPTKESPYYIDNDNRSFFSTDGGDSWQKQVYDDSYIDSRYYSTAAVGMFPNGTGFRIMNTDDGANISYIYKTEDSAQTFHIIPNREGFFFAVDDFVCPNTDHFWALDQQRIYHSTDQGSVWSVDTFVTLIDSIHRVGLSNIAVATDDRMYALYTSGEIRRPAPDFAETTDGGTSWRIDSSIGPHIYIMSSPAQNILWACVGHGRGTGLVGRLTDVFDKESYADSLFYSSDDGHTWAKDSTTFAGDTIVLMSWPDSTHGYIVAWRDSTLLLYRFIPNSDGVETPQTVNREISVFPNPASTSVTVSTSVAMAHVHVLDILGRDLMGETTDERGEVTLNISSLPRGVYAITMAGDAAILLAGKLVVQ